MINKPLTEPFSHELHLLVYSSVSVLHTDQMQDSYYSHHVVSSFELHLTEYLEGAV